MISGNQSLSAMRRKNPNSLRIVLKQTLKRTSGNLSEAARFLGVSRRTLARWMVFFNLIALLIACSSDPFVGADGGRFDKLRDAAADVADPPDASDDSDPPDVTDVSIKPDVSSDAPVDAKSDACAMMSGMTACGNAIDAYCGKSVSCGYMQSVAQCRGWLNANLPKFDCSNSNYNKSVCSDLATACASDEMFVTCGTIMTKQPDQTTAKCGMFFGQF